MCQILKNNVILANMKIEYKKIVRYLIMGLGSTIIDFGLSFIIILSIHENAEVGVIIAHVISFTIAQIFGYVLSKYWVFKLNSNKKELNTIIRYSLVTVFNILWSSALIWLLVVLITNTGWISNVQEIQTIAKVLSGPPLGIASYYMYKKFVFNNN
jgi:putative flippase GtrA